MSRIRANRGLEALTRSVPGNDAGTGWTKEEIVRDYKESPKDSMQPILKAMAARPDEILTTDDFAKAVSAHTGKPPRSSSVAGVFGAYGKPHQRPLRQAEVVLGSRVGRRGQRRPLANASRGSRDHQGALARAADAGQEGGAAPTRAAPRRLRRPPLNAPVSVGTIGFVAVRPGHGRDARVMSHPAPSREQRGERPKPLPSIAEMGSEPLPISLLEMDGQVAATVAAAAQHELVGGEGGVGAPALGNLVVDRVVAVVDGERVAVWQAE